MKFNALVCAAVIFLALAGCKPGHSVVGKWSVDMKGQTMTVEFTSDSKLTAVATIAQPAALTETILGTYTFDKDDLTVKLTDITLKAANASQQPAVDKYVASQKQTMLDQINKDNGAEKITWTSNDEFVSTDAKGIKETYTRVKG